VKGRDLIFLFTGVVAPWSRGLQAKQPNKVARIGYLTTLSPDFCRANRAVIGAFCLFMSVSAQSFAQVSDPESVGFSAARLREITDWYQAQIDAGALPGAVVAIERNGKLAYLQALGHQDHAKKVAMAPDAIFWIASMTKPVTSVAAMMLVDEGKLELTAPVSRYLPELNDMQVAVQVPGRNDLSYEPQKRPMQVIDLLRHTSGLVYPPQFVDAPINRLYGQARFGGDNTLADFVESLGHLPLAHQPGEVWEYSWSVDVLARLVEVASTQRFDQFLEGHLFRPLHMVDTGFYVPEEKLSRLVEAPEPRGPQFDVTRPRNLLSGGGGLVSTASDYLRFCQMLLNGGELDGVRILMPETVQRMTTNSLPPDIRFVNNDIGPAAGATWGLGFAIRSDRAYSQLPGSVGSYMWGGVWGTRFWVDPAEQLIAVLMIQVPPGASLGYANALRFLTYAALLDSEQVTHSLHVTSAPPTPAVLASYAGTYDFGPRAAITYPGLGLVPDKQAELIKVMHVFDDAPAARAGVLAGDVITAIDGAPVEGLTLNEVRTKLVGPADSKVVLRIVRNGADQPVDVSIVRGLIRRPMAQLRVRLEAGTLLVESTGAAAVFEFEQGKPLALRASSNAEFVVDGRFHTRMAFVRDRVGMISEAILNPGRWEQRGSRAN
jgi:CubicO group peptidase (beta-lactamase class C family)